MLVSGYNLFSVFLMASVRLLLGGLGYPVLIIGQCQY